METVLKEKVIESSKTILVNEVETSAYRVLYKKIDYRPPKIVNNFSKNLSIFEKEILFKNFLFKMDKLVSCLEQSKGYSNNKLIIDNILGNLTTSISSPLKNSLESELFEKEIIQFHIRPFNYKDNLRGGYYPNSLSKFLNNLISGFHFLINNNKNVNWNNFKKIYKYKRIIKWIIIYCTIFLILYLNKNTIREFLFLGKSKLKFLKMVYKKRKKLLFRHFQQTSTVKKIKLLKKLKFKPLEIFTGQKEKLKGKKTLKFIYEKIPKNEIKTFFRKLSNTIDSALKVKIKFKPFKKDGSAEELDFNTSMNRLFSLLSEEI